MHLTSCICEPYHGPFLARFWWALSPFLWTPFPSLPLPTPQVYELRVEAVLAELALLKAQCGCDYSLTLVSPARQVEVLTSGESTGRRRGRQSGHAFMQF